MQSGAVRSNPMQTRVTRVEGNVHYLGRRPRRAGAVALLPRDHGRDFVVAGASIITGGLIGFGLAHLPALSAVAAAWQAALAHLH